MISDNIYQLSKFSSALRLSADWTVIHSCLCECIILMCHSVLSGLQKSDFIHTRFFVALMLYDLYREMPVWDVANKYKQNRGFVQTMLQSAVSFASCVYYFSMVSSYLFFTQTLIGEYITIKVTCWHWSRYNILSVTN